MRYGLRALFILVAVVPPALWLAWSWSAVPTKEPPPAWLGEIAAAARWHGDDGPAHVLAWKIIEDDRPWRVESCLVVKQLNQPTENQERWLLGVLGRGGRVRNSLESWEIKTVYGLSHPDESLPPVETIHMHLQGFRERPTNSDIYAFLDRHDWRLGADDEWKLIDGGISRAWQQVIRERPERPFSKAASAAN